MCCAIATLVSAFIAAITATATTTTIATTAAIATWATAIAAAAFALFAWWAGVFQLFTGFLVNNAHRQANLAAIVEADQLDLDFIAFLDDVGHLANPLRRQF